MIGMYALCIIVITVGVSVMWRARAIPRIPIYFWPVAIITTAIPLHTGYLTLFPQESVDTKEVASLNDAVNIKIPKNHSLLVTANLAELKTEKERKDPDSYKSEFYFQIRGLDDDNKPWSQNIAGSFSRQNKSNEAEIKVYDGQEISSGTRKRSSGLFENIQDRFVLDGTGEARLKMTNYQGGASSSIQLEIIPAPPSSSILWLSGIFLSALGIYFEAWYKCDKLAQDLGFLAFLPVFMVDTLAPLDGWGGVAKAGIATFLIGYGIVAGLAFLTVKYKDSRDKALAEEEEEEEED
jgi:hypothetical protein